MDKSQWLMLMSNLGYPNSEDIYNDLLTHYQQKHRCYHNATHLAAVLGRLSESQHLAIDKHAIEVALWFHDAIYAIVSSSNEKDSADWAVSFLASVDAKPVFTEKVRSLIMATEHNVLATDNDEQLIIDIDLSILGSSTENYALFEFNIRKEYKIVPWFIFRKKRAEVLKSFLERDKIYSHAYFYDKLEANARRNLSNAIQQLQNGAQ